MEAENNKVHNKEIIKDISIVIVNYNSYEETIEYVNSLLNQIKVNLFIIVVDNDSSDNSYLKLEEYYNVNEAVFILESGRNGGYSYGNNVGIKFVEEECLSDNIIISNNDIELDGKDFLYKFIKQYESLPNDKAFASPVMYINGDISSIAARKLPTLKDDIILSSIVLSKIFRFRLGIKIPNTAKIQAVDCLPGSLFIGKVTLFKKIEYFDERFFLFGEERVIAHKIRELNLNNYLICNLKFFHEHSAIIDNVLLIRDKLKLIYKGKILYWGKYKGLSGLSLLVLKCFFKICIYEKTLYRSIMKLFY